MPFDEGAELVRQRRSDRVHKVIANLEPININAIGWSKGLRAIERNLVNHQVYSYDLHTFGAEHRSKFYRKPATVFIVGLNRLSSDVLEKDKITQIPLRKPSQVR